MRFDRRRRLIALGALGVAILLVLAFLVISDDGNDPDSLAVGATTTTTRAATTTSAAVTVATTLPTTTAAAVPAPTRVPATTAPTPQPTTPPRCPAPGRGSDFDGFGATEIVIDNSQGSHRSCVLTADTDAQQQRGLMRQNDLDGYDGMIFRFAKAEEQSFWMRNTSIPLSIAFFDGAGAFVSASDMAPCGDRADCPHYNSGGAARYALEVIQGRLPAVGGTPGSRLIG